MNDDILTLIQAELDGLASAEQIARLDAASAIDSDVREARAQFQALAGAVSRMPAIETPAGFTDRVMAALPPAREARVRPAVPLPERIRTFVQSVVPAHRHQVAFAFALGVVVTLGLSVLTIDLGQPGVTAVSGTLTAPSGTRVPLAGGAGILEASWSGDVGQFTVTPTDVAPLRITVTGEAGTGPDVTAAASGEPVTLVREAGSVVLEAGGAGPVRFFVHEAGPVHVRVTSGDAVLIEWDSASPGH